ncbi:C40 family peptidase [Phormidium yuhuli AB48]|uniref:C40 family peptidase n=1 Tax=Phormidium yuhuli AB48 TaxID=2940671 RepID=A0ABY5ASH9_9CYAN|nr:C40 family peptidase [Phormidium yuhuli]USR92192.1 C40 family peptidase [Phormidium yuhuli AB48]
MATGAIELHESGEYRNLAPLNLYDSPQRDSLATQAATGRYLRILSLPHGDESSLRVRLCEDDYPGWLAPEAVVQLEPVPSSSPYVAVEFSEMEIRDIIPEVIEFTKQAMAQPNHYLWGGTLGPNYDCSGLMQAAFASVGVWLPRDAYLQEAFTLAVSTEAMQPGDLVFFGPPLKATHVGLYLGGDRYIHSSGRELGHNGIAIDRLANDGSQVSRNYRRILRGAGRVIHSYHPGDLLPLQPD